MARGRGGSTGRGRGATARRQSNAIATGMAADNSSNTTATSSGGARRGGRGGRGGRGNSNTTSNNSGSSSIMIIKQDSPDTNTALQGASAGIRPSVSSINGTHGGTSASAAAGSGATAGGSGGGDNSGMVSPSPFSVQGVTAAADIGTSDYYEYHHPHPSVQVPVTVAAAKRQTGTRMVTRSFLRQQQQGLMWPHAREEGEGEREVEEEEEDEDDYENGRVGQKRRRGRGGASVSATTSKGGRGTGGRGNNSSSSRYSASTSSTSASAVTTATTFTTTSGAASHHSMINSGARGAETSNSTTALPASPSSLGVLRCVCNAFLVGPQECLLQCRRCLDWSHPACVGVDHLEMRDHIRHKTYVCPFCVASLSASATATGGVGGVGGGDGGRNVTITSISSGGASNTGAVGYAASGVPSFSSSTSPSPGVVPSGASAAAATRTASGDAVAEQTGGVPPQTATTATTGVSRDGLAMHQQQQMAPSLLPLPLPPPLPSGEDPHTFAFAGGRRPPTPRQTPLKLRQVPDCPPGDAECRRLRRLLARLLVYAGRIGFDVILLPPPDAATLEAVAAVQAEVEEAEEREGRGGGRKGVAETGEAAPDERTSQQQQETAGVSAAGRVEISGVLTDAEAAQAEACCATSVARATFSPSYPAYCVREVRAARHAYLQGAFLRSKASPLSGAQTAARAVAHPTSSDPPSGGAARIAAMVLTNGMDVYGNLRSTIVHLRAAARRGLLAPLIPNDTTGSSSSNSDDDDDNEGSVQVDEEKTRMAAASKSAKEARGRHQLAAAADGESGAGSPKREPRAGEEQRQQMHRHHHHPSSPPGAQAQPEPQNGLRQNEKGEEEEEEVKRRQRQQERREQREQWRHTQECMAIEDVSDFVHVTLSATGDDFQRRGLARLLMAVELLRWGLRGRTRAFLNMALEKTLVDEGRRVRVAAPNASRALYRAFGFRDVYPRRDAATGEERWTAREADMGRVMTNTCVVPAAAAVAERILAEGRNGGRAAHAAAAAAPGSPSNGGEGGGSHLQSGSGGGGGSTTGPGRRRGRVSLGLPTAPSP